MNMFEGKKPFDKAILKSQKSDYMQIWLEHFFYHAKPIKQRPRGWGVYIEALELD